MFNRKQLLFVFIFTVISTFHSSAQFESVVLQPFDSLIHLNVYGDFSSISNHVPHSFVMDFTEGGFLDSETKHSGAEKLGNFNRYQFHASYGASVLFKPRLLSDSVNFVRMFAGYDRISCLFTSFTDDAFNLLMFGNAFTLGNIADLSNTSLSWYDYNRFYAGAMRSFGKNGDHRFAIAPFISFHKPPVFMNITEASLFTAEDTSRVDVFINGNLEMAYEVETITASIGGGVDLHYVNSSLLTDYLMHFSVENLGVFQYQGASYLFHTDSIVSINSFYISSFSNIDSTLNEFADSMYKEIVTIEDSISLTCMLPLKLSLTFINTSSGLFNLHGRISWYPLFSTLPLIELIPSFKLNNVISLGIPLSWGETGSVQAGFFAKVIYKKLGFTIMLKSAHNMSVNPYHTGFSASGQLSYRF